MAKDRYRYFRLEGRDLLDAVARSALALERAPSDSKALRDLKRAVHTLKGAAYVVEARKLGELAHAVEEAIATAPADSVPRAVLDRLLALSAAMEREFATIGEAPVEAGAGRKPDLAAAPAAPPPAPTPEVARPAAPASRVAPLEAAAAERTASMIAVAAANAPAIEDPLDSDIESIRVELAELDTLGTSIGEAAIELDSTSELEAQLGRLAAHLAALRRVVVPAAASPALAAFDECETALRRARAHAGERLARSRHALAQVDAHAQRLRLVAIATIVPGLERAARDAAHELGKQVTLEATGVHLRLEAHALTGVRAALTHAVRNAVDHGLEPPAARLEAGKRPAGRIRIEVRQRGDRIAIACTDDGRGIDDDAVRARAVEEGLLDAEARPPTAQVRELLFRSGFTTKRAASRVSGRGVGLDAIRAAIEALGGRVTIDSTAGRGTTLEMVVPMTVASFDTLELAAGTRAVAIPLEAVRRVLHLAPSDVARTQTGAVVALDGRVLPFASLAAMLGEPATLDPSGNWLAVHVAGDDGEVVLAIDRLDGIGNRVVRPLPAVLGKVPLVLGASFDAKGEPHLVCDPAGLVRRAQSGIAPPTASAPTRARSVLVIDDSLTTRMLLETVLLGAGYEVALATSAEQGLEMALAGEYRLFLCDVEMPGMSGYDLVPILRRDPRLGSTPIVMITTLGSAADRRRGLDVGADAYIVKTEFDEAAFLQLIGELVEG